MKVHVGANMASGARCTRLKLPQPNGHQRPTRATPGRRRGYFHHTSLLPRPSLILFCMAVSESDHFLFDIKKSASSRPV